MRDLLATECNRFADLCAKVRPDWKVKIKGPDDEDDFPSVTVEGADSYDTYSRADCGAMIFWLLEAFPTVTLSIFNEKVALGPRSVKVWVVVGGWRTIYGLGKESEDEPLHHVLLLQLLLAVNKLLEHEVAQKKEADSTP